MTGTKRIVIPAKAEAMELAAAVVVRNVHGFRLRGNDEQSKEQTHAVGGASVQLARGATEQ